jgi:hypothetical protein
MTKRWYFETCGIDPDFDQLIIALYDADLYDTKGYQQDYEVLDDLPEELRFVLDEVAESSFFYDGAEADFRAMMVRHGIKALPSKGTS